MKNKVFMIMAVSILVCIAIFAGVFIGRLSRRDILTIPAKSDILSETFPKNELLNLNNVSEDELIVLLGIPPIVAKEIIAYRNTYGDFVYISELKNVPGMTQSIYEEIRPYLTLSD